MNEKIKLTLLFPFLLGAIWVHSQSAIIPDNTCDFQKIQFLNLKSPQVWKMAPQKTIELRYKVQPRKPFFCRMEDRMWNYFGVWIKFRAGSDEIYRKQISE